MTVQAPPRVEAEIMHRPMTAGRNRAILLGCRAASGASVDCVVKLAATLGGAAPVPYLVEWFAAALGQALGTYVAAPFEIVITPAFGASLAPPWQELAARSIGSAFGSQLGPATQWTPGALIPMELRTAAMELLAFDVFIHNPDRRVDNPNVHTSKDAIFAFDHGDAFSFVWPLVGALDPAEDPLLSGSGRA